MIIHVLLSAFTSRSSVSLIGLIPNVIGYISYILSLCLVVVFLHLLVILMCFYQPQTSRNFVGCFSIPLFAWLQASIFVDEILAPFIAVHSVHLHFRCLTSHFHLWFFIEILLMLRFQCFVSYISETVLVKSAYFGWSKYCCWLNPNGCCLISTSLHVA